MKLADKGSGAKGDQTPQRRFKITNTSVLALQRSEDFRIVSSKKDRSKNWPCAQ
jgi:hypothetical protein